MQYAVLVEKMRSVHMLCLLLAAGCADFCSAFAPVSCRARHFESSSSTCRLSSFFGGGGDNNDSDRQPPQPGGKKISRDRRAQLGISDDEDEYDLGFALAQNTDDGISKVVAGSFILVMIGLLVVGVIVPYLSDYGEGVCSPIQSAGRC